MGYTDSRQEAKKHLAEAARLFSGGRYERAMLAAAIGQGYATLALADETRNSQDNLDNRVLDLTLSIEHSTSQFVGAIETVAGK